MSLAKVKADAQEYMLLHPELGLGGWLIHDHRRSNPVFWQAIGQELGTITRPCYLHIPPEGEPTVLTHHVDAGKFQSLAAELSVYRNRASMLDGLGGLVRPGSRVAMEYSPSALLPRVSRVDAGTIELVRELGAEVVSSADLLQYATQRLNEAQVASHTRAAEALGRIVLDAFGYIGEDLATGVTERQVAEFIRGRFSKEGLHSPDGPIVATNAHASDPHYEPPPEGSSTIKVGDWVLIDLWAKEAAENSVYADITWVAYVGEKVPEKHQEVFQVVATARDSAVKYLEGLARQGISLQGNQVDRIAREYITRQGYGEYFTHRLGHSIGSEVHADAVNLDGFETEDTRTIMPGICFSIEPGVYLPEFGVRSEIDVLMTEEGPTVTTPVQRDVVLIRP